MLNYNIVGTFLSCDPVQWPNNKKKAQNIIHNVLIKFTVNNDSTQPHAHSTESHELINQLANTLLTCSLASLTTAPNERQFESSHCQQFPGCTYIEICDETKLYSPYLVSCTCIIYIADMVIQRMAQLRFSRVENQINYYWRFCM